MLSATDFSICGTSNTDTKHYLDQLEFVQDIIVPIDHISNWELINQCKIIHR